MESSNEFDFESFKKEAIRDVLRQALEWRERHCGPYSNIF